MCQEAHTALEKKKAESQLIETCDVATFRSDITFINLLAVFLHWMERGQLIENVRVAAVETTYFCTFYRQKTSF